MYIMSDNKKNQDGRDDSKIDSNDASEVEYAAKKFEVTPKRLGMQLRKPIFWPLTTKSSSNPIRVF
jgi:hypothetical protein